jgi:hypothetical protein
MARRASKISQLCAFVCLCASISAWSSEYHGQVFFGGVPVPGATVTVQKGDEQFSTVTDRQGLYEFADLADGQWKIEIEMSGFSKLDGKVTVTPDAPQGNWELKLLGLEQMLAQARRQAAQGAFCGGNEAGFERGSAEERGHECTCCAASG